MSIVRQNLLTRLGYTPYCGAAENCRYGMPRTQFNGTQFRCPCGWTSNFASKFIAEYVAFNNPPLRKISSKEYHAASRFMAQCTGVVRGKFYDAPILPPVPPNVVYSTKLARIVAQPPEVQLQCKVCLIGAVMIGTQKYVLPPQTCRLNSDNYEEVDMSTLVDALIEKFPRFKDDLIAGATHFEVLTEFSDTFAIDKSHHVEVLQRAAVLALKEENKLDK